MLVLLTRGGTPQGGFDRPNHDYYHASDDDHHRASNHDSYHASNDDDHRAANHDDHYASDHDHHRAAGVGRG
jgi:hypothetical protein